ncbi:hypothetical protein ZIOFF_068235 [Zingiber officinale]|uniref:dUTP diphosphatase n=1 Tax=Zingiber officinale TaxID=94328 RepID=A0A8J5CG48_ZINOF|nr:hypothetical protein ZIOFF_068235 [Zingiber officinale]
MTATRTEQQQVATTPLFKDQIRSYRRNQRRLYNAQQAARRIGQTLTGGSSTRHTLEQQIEPEAQLQLSMQERASIVSAEVLYHSRRDDAHHRVYVHRSEEAMLVTDNHQVDRSFIQEESFNQLRRSGMQYIHLGVLQVRVQILHRQREGMMTLIVFRDNRWQGDQAILGTMEVDLTHGSQMIYVIPEIMMTIGRLSNTPNVGFAYEIQGVVDYLTSHGVKALPGRSFSTRSLQGLNWVIKPTQISISLQPTEVNSQTMMDGRISLSFSNYAAAQPSEAPTPNYNNKDEEVYETLAVLIETQPGTFSYFDGTTEEYYEIYGDMDDQITKGKQIVDPDERYSSQTEPHILVNKISQHAVLPKRQTKGSADLDIAASHAAVIEPYGRDLIHTGLRIEIPHGYYGRLASRSGLAWKNGVEVGAGVIDSDYRALQLEQDLQKDFQELEEEAANMLIEETIAATSSPRFHSLCPNMVDRSYAWKVGVEPDLVLFFDCPEEEIVERILKRNQGRIDDNIDTIKKRLESFKKLSLPVIDHYTAKGKVYKNQEGIHQGLATEIAQTQSFGYLFDVMMALVFLMMAKVSRVAAAIAALSKRLNVGAAASVVDNVLARPEFVTIAI